MSISNLFAYTRGYGFLTSVLISCALITCNLLLLRQNLQLRNEIKRLGPEKLEIGEATPPFSVENFDGGVLRIDYKYQSRRTLLLYFSPSCLFSIKQIPYWRGMINSLRGSPVDIIVLAASWEDRSGVGKYIDVLRNGLKSDSSIRVGLVPNDLLRQYKLTLTPTTLLISPSGNVENVWNGYWDIGTYKDVESALGVHEGQCTRSVRKADRGGLRNNCSAFSIVSESKREVKWPN